MVTAAVIGGAVIGAVGTTVAASSSSDAAQSQADAATQASQTQAQSQANALQEVHTNTQPYRDVGQQSINQLAGLLGVKIPGQPDSGMNQTQALQQRPGYQFRLGEGQRAVENSAAARGMQLSGANLRAIDEYGQNFASNEYNNAYNQLLGLSSIGENAAVGAGNSAANIIQNTGNNVAGYQIGAGNAQAAGQVGAGNAISGGLSGIANAGSQYYALQNAFGKPANSGGGFTYDPSTANFNPDLTPTSQFSLGAS